MKREVFFLISLFSSCFCFAQGNKSVPEEIKKIILKGYEVLDYVTGDVNNDKKEDALLILKIAGEDTLQTENYSEPSRPLLILIRQENNTLKLAARNDAVVMCRQCGGVFGDPYESVSIEKALFKINFYGGSAWRWSKEYTFRYNAVKKDWFIYKESQTSYWNGDPDKSFSSATVNEDEITVVSFSKYKPLNLENLKEKKWQVKNNKVNFYTVATKDSKPFKAHLVKGDIVSSYWETKNFIFIEYENKAGKTTKGFIKKTNLVNIKTAGK